MSSTFGRRGWWLLLLAFLSVTEGRGQFAVPNAPYISSIFSPSRTVRLEWGDSIRLLRFAEVLPTTPFSMLSRENDLIEVTFPDRSILRQGPNTRVNYVPLEMQAAIASGSVLIHFGADPSFKVQNLELTGQDAVGLITVAPEGVKVFALSGQLRFREVGIKEGEMYFYNGQPRLQGPFVMDIGEIARSSPLILDLPANPWVEKRLARPISKQKWLKNLGLLQPVGTMMDGSSPQVRKTPAGTVENSPP